MAGGYSIGGAPFTEALKKFGEKANSYANAVTHRVFIDLTAAIINRSPYGNPALWKDPPPKYYQPGHFIGNWQFGNGVAPIGELNLVMPSSAAEARKAVIRKIAAQVPTKASESVLYLVNNSPYSERLEYDGWSTQAPSGMVGLTVQQFNQIVERAVADIAK